MVEITDEEMDARLDKVRGYPAVRLLKGPKYRPYADRTPEEAKVIREHGRRNMRLRAEGVMAMVAPIGNGGELVGMCIFNAAEDEVRAVMDGDGAVVAGMFVYDIITWWGVPGDGPAARPGLAFSHGSSRPADPRPKRTPFARSA